MQREKKIIVCLIPEKALRVEPKVTSGKNISYYEIWWKFARP